MSESELPNWLDEILTNTPSTVAMILVVVVAILGVGVAADALFRLFEKEDDDET